MRTILLFLFALCLSPVFSQDLIENYSYVSDKVVDKTYGLPAVRSIGGGTKIIVDYQGNWSEDMKGAFEFACKIWEEAMPTTFPIHILAKLDETITTNAFSKVSIQSCIHTQNNFSYAPPTNRSTWLQIKGTTIGEFFGIYGTDIYDQLLTPNMFYEHDIIITYYNKGNTLKNKCSFSLDEIADNTKFDFVTLALRDMAKGFGFTWQYNNPNNWPNINNNITAYEYSVLRALGYFEPNCTQASMLTNATQGSLEIDNGNWELYAPNEWDKNNSLATFIPNENKKITQLLSYDFGKGSIIRDISDFSTIDFFEDLLYWKGDNTVGIGHDGASTNEKSDINTNVIGYNGSISLSSNETAAQNCSNAPSSYSKTNYSYIPSNDTIYNIMKKYHPNYDGSDIGNCAGKVSLLLNDGTWDIVYHIPFNNYAPISVSNFSLHHENKDYARTTDGFLRCRITTVEDLYVTEINTKYYALDYIPQIASMAMSKVLNTFIDDYYTDVEISYKNIEGTTRIVVSQYDYGEEVPYQYSLSDIKSGKFTATVDKEYPTKFLITSYNKNGSTTSELYTLNGVQPTANLDLSFKYSNERILIESNSDRMNEKTLIKSYSIKTLNFANQQFAQKTSDLSSDCRILDTNTICVAGLKKGFYILNVLDIYGKEHSFKFMVK